MTMRRALEHSKNLATARLLDGGIASEPSQSLDEVCKLAVEAHVYPKCERYYPFVLGAQPVRPIDLAGFYAAIANEGKRAYAACDRADHAGRPPVYKADEGSRRLLAGVDPAAVFQLRSMLQGVVARGTAARLSSLSTSSAARPAPATISTTPGLRVSATTSPSWSGSATTTPRASARSATARPAAGRDPDLRADHAGRPGRPMRRRRRCRRLHRKRRAI